MEILAKAHNRDNYQRRLEVVRAIHQYLQQNDYLELDLPVLSPQVIPESYLEYFSTKFRYLDTQKEWYLTPSPELFIKRLLVQGVGRCYYLGKAFRNSEPNSSRHTPEFTMLEFYDIDVTYKEIADEVLSLLRHISLVRYGTADGFMYQKKEIALDTWESLKVSEAFEKYAGINPGVLFDHKRFEDSARKKGYVVADHPYEELFSQIYAQEVEPHLGMNGRPTILYDYPKEFAALAAPNTDGKTAQRFEFYIAGIELGNCYTELANWQEQEERFKMEEHLRKESGKINVSIDWEFIKSLKAGLPLCSGIAIGVDRLAMVFSDLTSIEDTKLIIIE